MTRDAPPDPDPDPPPPDLGWAYALPAGDPAGPAILYERVAGTSIPLCYGTPSFARRMRPKAQRLARRIGRPVVLVRLAIAEVLERIDP